MNKKLAIVIIIAVLIFLLVPFAGTALGAAYFARFRPRSTGDIYKKLAKLKTEPVPEDGHLAFDRIPFFGAQPVFVGNNGDWWMHPDHHFLYSLELIDWYQIDQLSQGDRDKLYEQIVKRSFFNIPLIQPL